MSVKCRSWMAVLAWVIASVAPAGEEMQMPAYKDAARPLEERIADLLERLTLEEKIGLTSGKNAMDTLDIPRLGIHSLKMTDGPHGVRWEKASCFPSGISMASTWNPALIERTGAALAGETLARGRNVLLGPCINICRTPLNGRAFEAFGEDPYLAARMAVAYIQGLQARGVAASVKHYAANNQERDRFQVSVEADERTLREIYLPAFRAAVVEADALTVMTAHNKVNGDYCSANDFLQNKILKDEWGFTGLTVSDWGGVHDTVAAALGGQDLEMPGPGAFFDAKLKEAVERGDVSEDGVDEKVRRILRVIFRLGLFDGAARPGAIDTPEHRALARDVAREEIVLLKNAGGLLPLDAGKLRTIAVIGPNAAEAQNGGGGSSSVTPFYLISPLDGLKERCGERVEVRYALGCPTPEYLDTAPSSILAPPGAAEGQQGLLGEYFDNPRLEGKPVFTRVDPQVDFRWEGSPGEGIGADQFSVRWTGTLVAPEDGDYEIGTVSDDGSRLYVDGRLVVDQWREQAATGRAVSMHFKKGEPREVHMEYFQAGGSKVVRLAWTQPAVLHREAVKLARSCDAVVLCVGLSARSEGEDRDRENLDLPPGQAALIRDVAGVNSNTVVVFVGGTPVVAEPWIGAVPAMLCAWYPGQEGGHAIAEVLFGDVNPSGKLPVTWPKRLEDTPAFGNYPGDGRILRYAEGLYVGYRHFDTRGVEPQFPFGHGLSYTEFAYSDLRIDPDELTVRFDLENVGARAGSEVAQLYVRDVESSLERPEKELKRFAKVELEPGEKKTVSFKLGTGALAFYDPSAGKWVAEPGEFDILVGSSSRDIRLEGKLQFQPPER